MCDEVAFKGFIFAMAIQRAIVQGILRSKAQGLCKDGNRAFGDAEQ